MPHYFFHLFNDLDVPDLEGRALDDAAAARALAIRECRAIVGEMIGSGRLDLSHRIEVEDHYRRPLFTVRFGDAVTIANAEPPPGTVA